MYMYYAVYRTSVFYCPFCCRERDLSREVALRRAAEQRLEQMVDMYGDPAVTEELRRRLPRAGKTDPKLRFQRELEELDHASSLHST